ncbi:hypothetical protein DRO58_02500 [Candidatus Bathyarchaeota archaeon]|nr:MAG: hypothetical protein DRO58_02500 [Candidatus Bathyarchaeota archaeon]
MRSYVGSGVGPYVIEKILRAERRVLVCCPYISREYADNLVELSKRGVQVWVLTSDWKGIFRIFERGKIVRERDFTKSIVLAVLPMLVSSAIVFNVQSALLGLAVGIGLAYKYGVKFYENTNLKVKVLRRTDSGEFIHAKIYVIDDEYAVTGSANLTYEGMWKNTEHITVYETAEEVMRVKSDFIHLWTQVRETVF